MPEVEKLNECLKELHLPTSVEFQLKSYFIFIYLKRLFIYYMTPLYHSLAFAQRTQQIALAQQWSKAVYSQKLGNEHNVLLAGSG